MSLDDDLDAALDATMRVFDAHAAALRNIAHTIAAYHHQLVQSGLTRSEALALTRDYHAILVKSCFSSPPDESVTWPDVLDK